MARRLTSRKRSGSSPPEIPPAQSALHLPEPPIHDLAQLAPRIHKALRAIVGAEHVLSDEADLIAYSIDGTWIERRPLAVVLPASATEVSAVLKLANRERIVVAPRGSASGLSGGALPLGGGIALALTRMNHILEIDRVNLLAVVEPGVITARLQAEVEKLGLFYPPD